mgnify:CR=1 FL=1
MNPPTTPIEQLVEYLRDEYRLKLLCDYAYTHDSYTNGFTFFTTFYLYVDDIVSATIKFGVPVDAIVVHEQRPGWIASMKKRTP